MVSDLIVSIMTAAGTVSGVDQRGSRRQFLQVTAAGIASGRQPCLGLIHPRVNAVLPAESHALYPSGVRFIAEGLGVLSTLPEEFDRLEDRVASVAIRLVKDGANAIVLLAPSISFYRGAAFNQHLSDQITKAVGVPFITSSTAIAEGLKLLGARRIAIASSYTNEINLKLQGFLNELDFEIVIIRGFGTERFEERVPVTEAITTADAIEFAAEVRESRPEADTLLIAFGSLPTHEIIIPLEKRCRIPVVSSIPHALWAGVRLLGLNARVPGFGTLLDNA
jgi:arylmalonate decarboxylase